MMSSVTNLNKYYVGRKKCATCCIRYSSEHKYIINRNSFEEVYKDTGLSTMVTDVLKLFNLESSFGFVGIVKGSGKVSQLIAIRTALSKLLRAKFKEDFKENLDHYYKLNSILRENNLLTVDTRKVEPKHYGRAKARKLRQRSKR